VVLPPLLRSGGLGGTRRKHRPGFRLATKNPARFRRRRRGAFSPPHPRRNQRLMIPSGPPRPPDHGFPLILRLTSFQRAKVLRTLRFKAAVELDIDQYRALLAKSPRQGALDLLRSLAPFPGHTKSLGQPHKIDFGLFEIHADVGISLG